jgi:hypothetical protein
MSFSFQQTIYLGAKKAWAPFRVPYNNHEQYQKKFCQKNGRPAFYACFARFAKRPGFQ